MYMTDALRQDLASGLRGLRKSPAFAVVALLTLSLGVGATSAIFNVVKAALLTPLPYEAPERGVMVWSKWVSFEKTWVTSQEVFDYEFARTLTTWRSGSTLPRTLRAPPLHGPCVHRRG